MLEKLGITALNDMQRQAGDAILHSSQDVVVLSPTGTGKTLAYLLPLVQLVNAQQDIPQALVIVPGRELAMQSDRVLRSMGCGLRSAACYGGRTAMDEHRRLRELKPQIIFGTPGRLNDHLDKGNISPFGIRYLVIDEFDKCLEMGFHDEMARLLKKLPGVRRHILLSATDGAIDHGPLTIDHSWKRINFLHKNSPSSTVRSALPLGSSKNGQCPKYLNQLCKGTTALGMNLLNEVLKEIEKRLGRTHNEDGIVTVDLDLLEYDGERFHHRDWERNYVKDLINEL